MWCKFKAKFIKGKLEELDKANMSSPRIPGCGQGSSADRTRIATTNGLRNSLKKMMGEFQSETDYHGGEQGDG